MKVKNPMKGSYARDLALVLVATVLLVGSARAQGTAQPSPQAKKPAQATRVQSSQNDNRTPAPQVVTILHRLSGLKMLSLMVRDDQQFKAIAQLDESFKLMGDVHTNVIAGLALDDGKTIVAWLPEVEAEMPPTPAFFTPKAAPVTPAPKLPAQPAQPQPSDAPFPVSAGLFQTPDLTVVGSGGRRFLAHYVGLDAASGLSVLRLEDKSSLPSVEVKDEEVTVGQRLRLFAPEPTVASSFGGRISVRVGETEGTITKVTQSPSGSIYKLKMKGARLSQANIGGIAVNDLGETVGIIDRIDRGEASIVSAAQIRSAARRVLARQSSVPRPWLGVSGEPVASLAPERLLVNGWKESQATELTQERAGILLTAVVPNSPAAVAALRPGDVILTVNGEQVRNAEDFSWFLQEAGPGGSVSFTVMHPGWNQAEDVSLKLSDAMDAAFFPKKVRAVPRAFSRSSLFDWGIEAIGLRPPVAAQLGANGGLLVVFVEPSSEAFKAGLHPGDLIESIDGRQVSMVRSTTPISRASVTLGVVRGKQRLTFTMENPQK